MYRFKQSLIAFAGLFALVSAVALLTPQTGRGQKAPAAPSPLPSPHPVNVVVTNTPLPVAIAGSVNVGNTLSVNVANTPTVRLDPAGNEVTVAPRGTKLVCATGLVNDPANTNATLIGPINVSEYSKIRVGVSHLGASDIRVIPRTALVTTPTISLENSFPLDSFDVEDNVGSIARNGPSVSRLYEVTGTTLFISLLLGSEEHDVRVAVFGS